LTISSFRGEYRPIIWTLAHRRVKACNLMRHSCVAHASLMRHSCVTRASLMRHSCIHRRVKACNLMLADALAAAEPVLHLRDRLWSAEEFCALDDSLLARVEHPDPLLLRCLDDAQERALSEAQAILKALRRREIYAFINEILVPHAEVGALGEGEKCVRTSCVTHASLMRRVCVTRASLMRHACVTHASLVRHSFVTRASRMRHSCNHR
jgi:hypothetical protein